MRQIRIDFADFHPNFCKTDFYLYKVLAEHFDVELCDQPDFLIYSWSGQSHRLHSGVRILFSGEMDPPDYRDCDYSLGSIKLEDPRHLHFPNYVHYGEPGEIIKAQDDPAAILAAKTKFCSFVVSGYQPRKNGNRVEFFQKLCRYKKVDSGGRKFNNIGGPIPEVTRGKAAFLRPSRDKIHFLQPYKFNIAYENRSLPGYTTEKIFEAMVARNLPIYWGDPAINDHFNPRSFLNRADFASDEALIEKIIELDQDDEKYLAHARQPYFYNDTPNQYFSRARLLEFFEKIFTQKITPVAQAGRKSFFGRVFGRWQLVKRHHWHPLQPPTW
jgi:hypothetical protein